MPGDGIPASCADTPGIVLHLDTVYVYTNYASSGYRRKSTMGYLRSVRTPWEAL